MHSLLKLRWLAGLVLLCGCANPFGAGFIDPSFLHPYTSLSIEVPEFGAVERYQTSERVLVLSNTGGVPAKALQAQLSSPFAFKGGSFPGTGGTCPATLKGLSSCLVVIELAAPNLGNYEGSLTLSFLSGQVRNSVKATFTEKVDDGKFNRVRGFDQTVRTMLKSSTGALYVAGAFSRYHSQFAPGIAKFLSGLPTTLDATFDPGMGISTPFSGLLMIFSMAEDSSGRLYLGGNFTRYDGIVRYGIARIHPDGALDTTFVPPAFNKQVNFVSVGSDGKVYVGGEFTQGIARLNSDGSQDTWPNGTGFGASPRVNTLVEVVGSAPCETAATPCFYVAGNFSDYTTDAAGVTNRESLIRLKYDGEVDTTFDASLSGGTFGFVEAVAPLSDGRVYVGGQFTSPEKGIVRVHWNGAIDPTFKVSDVDGDGFGDFVGLTNGAVYRILPDASGLYAVGNFQEYRRTASLGVVRIKFDGSFDESFSVGSGANADLISDQEVNTAVVIDESLCIGGRFNNFNDEGAKRMACLKSDGSFNRQVENGSGVGGITGSLRVNALVVDPSRKDRLHIGGNFFSLGGAIAADHFSQVLFNGMPVSPTPPGLNGEVTAIAPALDGSDIFVGGSFTFQGTESAPRLARLNRDAELIPFAIGTGFNGSVLAIAPSASGGVYAGGNFSSYDGSLAGRIARLDSAGFLDTTFATGTGFGSIVNAIVETPDTSIYVGANFSAYKGASSHVIRRIDANGNQDNTFAPNTMNGSVSAIALDDGGEIVIGGTFTTLGAETVNRIVRLNSDGSRDTEFSIEGGTNGFSSTVKALAFAQDGTGDIYVGGDFTSFNGTMVNRIVRLTSSGAVNPDFAVAGVSGGFSGGSVNTIVVAPDGSGDIYVGGAFTAFGGVMVDGVARLSATGQLE